MPKALPGCREEARGHGIWHIGLVVPWSRGHGEVPLAPGGHNPLPSEVSGLYWCSFCTLTACPYGRERSTLA